MRLGIVCLAMQLAAAGMQPKPCPPLTVVVLGTSAVTPREWSEAEAVARGIFARAGVATNWLRDVSCDRGSVCLHVSRTLPPGLHRDAAGYAVISAGERSAALLIPEIRRTAEECEVDPGVVLGAAMAHEIGHLLLHRERHSGGVMSERFDRHLMRLASRSELSFLGDEAEQLKLTVCGR